MSRLRPPNGRPLWPAAACIGRGTERHGAVHVGAGAGGGEDRELAAGRGDAVVHRGETGSRASIVGEPRSVVAHIEFESVVMLCERHGDCGGAGSVFCSASMQVK